VGEALDVTALLARVDGDAQLLSELALIFVQECPRMTEDIRRALEDQDPGALERAAHTLKGSVGNFAATGSFKAALNLERIGRSGTLDSAPSAFEHLENELTRLIPVLVSLGTGVVPCES
jgi:HPt (histidine-containing phosphotransfer) domain-containing protein